MFIPIMLRRKDISIVLEKQQLLQIKSGKDGSIYKLEFLVLQREENSGQLTIFPGLDRRTEREMLRKVNETSEPAGLTVRKIHIIRFTSYLASPFSRFNGQQLLFLQQRRGK